MNDRLLSLLGICRRAGRLVIGADPVIESAHKGKSRLIVYASDFSKKSLRHVLETAYQNNIKVLCLGRSKDEVSMALGKLCGVLSVEDSGFAGKLIQLIEQEQGGEFYD